MFFRRARFHRLSFVPVWAAILAGMCVTACKGSNGNDASERARSGQTADSSACENPAPLSPPNTTGSRFILQFADSVVDPDGRIDALEEKYGITAAPLPNKAFVADLTKEQLAAMRCEPDVASIAEDTMSSPTGS